MSKILVVDDSYDLRMLVEAYLRAAGHQVTLVNDGEAGLKAATAEPPDLILTDFQMPRLDGFGLLSAVRAAPRTAHVPVIMLTAYNRKEMLAKALRAGVDDFLGKPFKKEELLETVATGLKAASAASETAAAAVRVLPAPPPQPAGSAPLRDASGSVLSCELCLDLLNSELPAADVAKLVNRLCLDAREALKHHGGRVLWFTSQRFVAVFDETNRTHQGADMLRALRGALLVVLAAQRLRSWAGRRFPGRMIPELAVAIGVEAGPVDERPTPAGHWLGGRTAETAGALGQAARKLGWSIVVTREAASRGIAFAAGRAASLKGAPSGTPMEAVEVVGLPGMEKLVSREQQLYALAEAAVERNSALLRSLGPPAAKGAGPAGAPVPAPRPDFARHRVVRKLADNRPVSVFLVEAEGAERVLKAIVVDDKTRLAALERFLANRPTASVVQHPNVARVFGQGMSGNTFCIVSEYCPGGDLGNLIADRMVADDVVKALLRMCVGLKAAHEKGVFHGDLTAANVRIRADGSLAITDFQTADVVERGTGDAESGVIARSPHYISPEVVNGQAPDAQSDLYSLGILFHEMLTGARPYASNDVSQIMFEHLKAPVPKLPEVLARFQPLLDRLMAKERKDRFASVQDAMTFMAQTKLAGG